MDEIRSGAVGPEVLDVQRRLDALGLSAEDDPGVFGVRTYRVVQLFQQQRGLTADGVVGEDTWRSLVEAGLHLGDRLLYLTRPLLRGDDVRDLQRRLNRLGFDAGHVDGVLGTATFEAIQEFQLNAGIAVDGIAGRETIDVLRRLHRQHQSSPAFAVREREALRRLQRVSLAGAPVMLDPAHGPDQPGLVVGGIAEHTVAWQIADRVAGRLGALGARVVLSRGPATTPSGSERARLANREEVEAIVSIRLNGLESTQARGAAAYYFGQEGYVSDRGRRLASLTVDYVVEATGTPNCRTHWSTASILRMTRAPAVLVEPGFLTHPEEGPLLRERSYQRLLADALVAALVTFFTGRPPEPMDAEARRLALGAVG